MRGAAPGPMGAKRIRRRWPTACLQPLRELDRAEIRTIFARCPEGTGVTYAVQNRLKKAAGFHIVTEDQL